MSELKWIESRNTFEKYLFAQLLPYMIAKYESVEKAIEVTKNCASKAADQFFGVAS